MQIPLATRWHMLGILLPLSQFQPYCIAACCATAGFLSANILIIS